MCEHNTTIVKYDQGNVQVEVCTWGCGQTLIGVKDVTGLTRTFTIAELSALRERVEALHAILYEINSMNDMANLEGAELWNVNGETQKRVDAALQAP